MNLSKLHRYYLYLTVFLSGAAVLVLEILGSRVLAPFYGSTIFVWSSLISVALGFLSLGYFLGGRFVDKNPKQHLLYVILGISGASVIGSYQFKRVILVFSDNFGLKYGPLVSSILFFGIAFTFFGMVSPFAIRLLTEKTKSSGSSSGFVFALGTIGSLTGALVAGFYLIPTFSIAQIVYGLSIFLILLSLYGVSLSKEKVNIKIKNIAGLFFIILFFGFLARRLDWPNIKYQLFDFEVVYEENNFYGISQVIGIPRALDGRTCFLIDASVQSCIDPRNKDEVTPYEKLIALFKMVPDDSRVLILGMGGGQLFREYDEDRFYFDIVDINPVALKAVELAKVKLPTRHEIFIEDARNYLRKTDRKYDVIFVDLFNNVSPVSHMLSLEAFELLSSRLKADGILVMSHTGRTDGNDFLANSTIRTLEEVFDHVYTSSDHPDEFFSYVLFIASGVEINTEPINGYIETRNNKFKTHLADFFEVRYSHAQIITDDFNPSDYLWTDNLVKFETVESFRNKYKRLATKDYL